MTNRQALLSVIDQLPDQQLITLLAFAQQLSQPIDLENNHPELSPEQLADLRSRLSQFAEEWDSPEMEIYNDYESQSLYHLESLLRCHFRTHRNRQHPRTKNLQHLALYPK